MSHKRSATGKFNQQRRQYDYVRLRENSFYDSIEKELVAIHTFSTRVPLTDYYTRFPQGMVLEDTHHTGAFQILLDRYDVAQMSLGLGVSPC